MTPPAKPNRAAEIAAKAARLAASTTAVSSSSPTPLRTGVSEEQAPGQGRPPASPGTPPPRTKPVRLSVDVPPADHAALMQMSVALAGRLGATRIHHQEILRALLHLAITDPALTDRVREEIQARRRLQP